MTPLSAPGRAAAGRAAKGGLADVESLEPVRGAPGPGRGRGLLAGAQRLALPLTSPSRAAWGVVAAALLAACAEPGASPATDAGACRPACEWGQGCVSGTCVDGAPDAGGEDLAPRDARPRDARPSPGQDASFTDAGVLDAGAVDAGPTDPCAPPGSMCVEARACGSERPGPSNCPLCPPEHSSLCLSGQCVSPPELELGDAQEVAFEALGGLGPRLGALVGVVLARETSGGARLACGDVRAPGFDLGNACFNVLNSRLKPVVSQPGQLFAFSFGRFVAGQDVLLLVYGFERTSGRGDPIGLSCTEHVTGPPGSGPAFVSGQPMRPL